MKSHKFNNNLILILFSQFSEHALYSCSSFLVILSFHADGLQVTVTYILKLFVMFLSLWNSLSGVG